MEQYSFSKLKQFYDCPYAYYLTYIEKQKGIENAFSQYGSFNHSILQKYAEGKLQVYELLDEFIQNFHSSVTYDFPYNKWCDLREKYFNDGIKYYTNFEGFDDYNILGIETEFLESIDNKFNLKGYIDLTLQDKKDNEIIIVDHKSKAGFKNKKEQYKYARQLYTYCIYTYRHYGKYPKQLKFNMFRTQCEVTINFDIKDYNETIKWINDTVDLIGQCQDFYYIYDQFQCQNLCGHREICKYKQQKDGDENKNC